MGALQMGIGAVASAMVGLLFNGTALPMTGVMAACAVTAFLILFAGQKQIRHKAREQDLEEQAVDLVEKY